MENQKEILESLSIQLNSPCKLISATSVPGGDINQSFKIQTNLGRFFVKENNAEGLPEMFQKEAAGLEELSKTNFKIPKVIVVNDHFLILEWLEISSKDDKEYWRKFGVNLAKMHQLTANYFGLETDNYIGSLPQLNSKKTSWTDFFIQNRLEIQVKMALDSGKVSGNLPSLFERLYCNLENLFPKEKSSLLHGDLWSGNIMRTKENTPAIFDPAVCYGHREMDLSMTRLFGGFNPEMYNAYEDIFPLESGYSERAELYDLYPLMVHVNLFGGGYVRQVEQILARFT